MECAGLTRQKGGKGVPGEGAPCAKASPRWEGALPGYLAGSKVDEDADETGTARPPRSYSVIHAAPATLLP